MNVLTVRVLRVSRSTSLGSSCKSVTAPDGSPERRERFLALLLRLVPVDGKGAVACLPAGVREVFAAPLGVREGHLHMQQSFGVSLVLSQCSVGGLFWPP
eukprot:9464176-Pyramimonas_sp.AAC.2